MNPIREFKLSIEIDAPLEMVWREMVDWEGQSAWMLSTRVYDDHSSPSGVGHRLRAFTGPFARVNRVLGVMDEMVVSEWEPPRYCRVEHVGRIIRGYGTFTLSPDSMHPQRTRFDWFEEIDAPGPILLLIKPGVLMGVWISLQKFKRIVEKSRKKERGQEID
jgi:uncharacterized protein YndB with AHSA1/START domain